MGKEHFIDRIRDTVGSLSNADTNVAEEQGEDKTNMSASMTTDLSTSDLIPAASTARLRSNCRRRISVEAGHALEKLGHAVEYLTDEYVHCGVDMSSGNGQIEAVQLLMRINRQVYFECPEVPTMGERIRSMLHIHTAWKSSGDRTLQN